MNSSGLVKILKHPRIESAIGFMKLDLDLDLFINDTSLINSSKLVKILKHPRIESAIRFMKLQVVI